MKRQRAPDNESLTPWEVKQLMTLPGLRERLADELLQIHRCGSMVDAFASHTSLLIHMLAYAWRSTNALMRTCKRFHAVVHNRDYWKALARRAFASQVPAPVLNEVDWFHGLSDDEVAYSYLWSCILSPRSKRYGLLQGEHFQNMPSTLFLTHFRTEELIGMLRRVLRLRWHQTDKNGPYWWSLASFCVQADTRHAADATNDQWIPVYVTYYGHPRLRRRMFVTQQVHLLSMETDWFDQPSFINCYCELWDPEQQRTWHGTGPLTVSQVDNETIYSSWNPGSLVQNWGTWK